MSQSNFQVKLNTHLFVYAIYMKVLKELSRYIIGLIFIILGFLTFSYIEYVNQRPAISDTILYYVIAAGFVFMAIGIILMVSFSRKDLKKKSAK